MRVLIAKQKGESQSDRLVLRELSSAMNIFSEPHGNRFSISRERDMDIAYFRNSRPRLASILNVAELAGLVHMPTLYVKTP